MPRIREYEAANVKLNPNNLGETAIDQAARRLSTYTSQEASGAREIGQLQEQTLVQEGKQIEAFVRYLGLSTEGGGGVRTQGGKVEKTLIGTGAGGDITRNIPDPTDFESQGELLRGARRISRVANNMVSRATPLADLPNPKRTKEIYDKDTKNVADPNNPDAGVQAEESARASSTGEDWRSPGSWTPDVQQGQAVPDNTQPVPDLNTGGMDTPYPYPSEPAASDTSTQAAPPAPDNSQPGLASDIASDISNWMTSPP